jgi:hypothetical protein
MIWVCHILIAVLYALYRLHRLAADNIADLSVFLALKAFPVGQAVSFRTDQAVSFTDNEGTPGASVRLRGTVRGWNPEFCWYLVETKSGDYRANANQLTKIA